MQEHRRSIFIVDNEEPILKALMGHLTEEGYRVIQSPDGNGLVEKFRGAGCELLICDIDMEMVDGVDFLEFSRENIDSAPVIVLTGDSDASGVAEVVKKGAFDCITKPLKKENLLETIRRAFDWRDLLLRNRRLEAELQGIKMALEFRVDERTRELSDRVEKLSTDYVLARSANIQFVNILAETIESNDRFTSGHCNRMRYLSVELGRHAGLTPEETDVLEYAALLHDLGNMSISKKILNKDGPLTEPECSEVRRHPTIGEQILKVIPLMEQVAVVIAAHHESYDGSGYPKGLKGEEIPILSRIIAVADAFDAMSSDRPYRKGLELEVVLGELARAAGTQLDPELVKIFVKKKVYSFVKN
jgi:response regulator RpfG family c-di-GMP phosphodiesterase